MSIKQEEAINYWSGGLGHSEFSYFEMGFDKAIEAVGNCFECDNKYDKQCPIGELIKEVDLLNFYCASFDSKDV